MLCLFKFSKPNRSVKKSDLVHFFRAQGEVVPPFPCTLFFTYFHIF